MRYQNEPAIPELLLTETAKIVSVSKAILIGLSIIIFLLLTDSEVLAQSFQYKLEPMPSGWIAHSDQGQSYPGAVLRIYGGDWGVSTNKSGVVIDVLAFGEPSFRSFEHFKNYAMNEDYGFNAQPIVEKVNFNGYPAFRSIVKTPTRIYEGYYFQAGVYYITIVSDIADLTSNDITRWKSEQEQVLKGLSFPGSPPPSTPAEKELRPCKGVIHLPSDLKPGEVLSPSYTITDQDGKAPKGEIYPVLYINGVQAHSVVWDGNEARIELQVSCQGYPLVVKAVIPAYGAPPPPPADTTFPPDNDSPIIPPLDDYSGEGSDYDSSPAGLSKIPPPENAGQAMAGLLIPGIISVILGILGQSGAAVSPSGGSGSSKAKAGSAYDFGDGRDYYEGQSYTFDNGKKYKIDNGEFVPTAGLRDGEGYTDPDGNRKIWVGGQPWYEADWRRQAATNDAYTKAHKQDVDSYWDKRQQEIHEEQAALHEKDEAEKAKDREIEAEREKVKELIRKTIEIQMDIDQIRVDIANRSAKLADRITRTAEAIKYVCDKSIDIAAKIPGPKGEAFKAIRKAYRVTSAMAGGVGEGMASGNWTDSMVDATGAAVSNFIEDSIKTDRYKKGFEVFRGGTGEAWQQGRKAYKKGESIAGAAATGFVEGAASEASKKAKEALEELAPGSKYSYTIGESAFKAGYKEYKKGGDIGDVMRASGSGYVDGGIDAAMDYGVGKIFDNVLPENVSEKTLADHIKYIEELEEQGIWMELYDTNRFPELKEMLQEDFTPEIIYEKIKEEANKVVTKAATKVTQNVVKGKPFDDKLFS